jgi:hypothetical protein
MFVACVNPREFNAVGDIVWYPQELTLLSPIKHTFCSQYLFQKCRVNNQWRTNHVSTNTPFRFVYILFAMYSYNLGKVRADIFGSVSNSDNRCRIGICKFKGSLSTETLVAIQRNILIHHQCSMENIVRVQSSYNRTTFNGVFLFCNKGAALIMTAHRYLIQKFRFISLEFNKGSIFVSTSSRNLL